MKKQFFLTTLLISSLGFSAAGQGNFNFSTGAKWVWGPGGTIDGPWNVAFLWSANLSATTLVSQVTGLSHIPTNTPTVIDPDSTWNAIMTDPNYHFGVDAGTSAIAIATLTPTGGISYNNATPFSVAGTSTGGGDVMAFFLAWPNIYADPSAAAANRTPFVGWSNPFLYQYAPVGVAPTSMGLQSIFDGVDSRFGIATWPEPSTFSLTVLGAAALLLFRRRVRRS